MMIKTLTTIIACILLLALYKHQHVKPVDNPKDSPLFQQRLQSSLKRFEDGDTPDRVKDMQEHGIPDSASPSQPPPPAYPRTLTASGRCGTVYLTWVEDKKIAKEHIQVKRKTANDAFVPLKDRKVYEQEDAAGTRYWIVDSELANDRSYEYLISFKDDQGKETIKEPVSHTLTCTEQDRELLARQQQLAKEYSQKMGVAAPKDMPKTIPSSPSLSLTAKDLIASGRCGRVTLTWFEERGVAKESIAVKRKVPAGTYTLIEKGLVYERAEGGGVRYWISDRGLTDGSIYEYLISFKDANGRETVRGPVTLTLTCTDLDRAVEAQQEQAIRDYYQKRGIDYNAIKTSPYQLSEKRHTIDIGNAPQKGNPDAPVTLIVFTDFECTHCATWAHTLDVIQNTFPSGVKIIFKNFLIPYHTSAERAARAAIAAGEQGKFWEMHDLLFNNQTRLNEDDILEYAQHIKLDLHDFQRSVISERIQKVLDEDKAQGKTLGVTNVPTTFINGRSMIGSPPLSIIKGLVEESLKAQRQ